MKTFAVLNGDSVINLIVADSQEIAEEITGSTCVEYTSANPASISGTYDGSTFTDPVIE